MRQTLRVNRYMPLDTAHFLARIVAFFYGGIRVLRVPACDVLLPPDFFNASSRRLMPFARGPLHLWK